MKKIIKLLLIILVISGIIISYKIVKNNNSYLKLYSNKTDELWNEYDNYLKKLSLSIDKIKEKNYQDKRINELIRVFIKNFYENHKDNSIYSNSFYDLKEMKKIKKDFLISYIHDKEYNVLGYQEIFSVNKENEYEVLNNYLELYLLGEKYLEVEELDFEQILNIKINQIQIINSLTTWLSSSFL